MSRFLDLRYAPVGGDLAGQVSVVQATSLADYATFRLSELRNGLRGRHVLLVTHGYNVDRAAGIAALSNWERLLRIPGPGAVLGVLWPGDSSWAHGLDYPAELSVADHAGAMLAAFLDAHFQQAASLSFASHSLGARLVLAAIRVLARPVRRLILMAGAVDHTSLTGEFAAAAAKVGTISVLASRKDSVLARLFPLGNFIGGILDAGHPWLRAAIGRCGPAQPWPANFEAPFEIPDAWDFQHGNYLQIDASPPPVPLLTLPVQVPPQGTGIPAHQARGWQEAFTSAFASTRFR